MVLASKAKMLTRFKCLTIEGLEAMNNQNQQQNPQIKPSQQQNQQSDQQHQQNQDQQQKQQKNPNQQQR